MAVFGIDYAWGRPGVHALRKAKVNFVCRYLSHDTSGKNLTLAEAWQLSGAEILLVVVWETTAKRALDGHRAGAVDAEDALKQAAACGMPDDRPIYFAVDFDASASQQGKINDYLTGTASVLGLDRVGIYGGYGPVKRALDADKARFGWQTYAWSGGKWDSRAHIQQYSNDHTINEVSVDHDRAMKNDYGQWKIAGPPPDQVENLEIDGQFGPRTCTALQRALNRHLNTDLPDGGTFDTATKKALQTYLKVTPDGRVGPATVRALQRRVGAGVDGAWGAETTSALQYALNCGEF